MENTMVTTLSQEEQINKTYYTLTAWRKAPIKEVVVALFNAKDKLKAAGIVGEIRRHFLAQMLHESSGFVYLKEIASGVAYEGRKDLGNTEPGDGKKYKGRGIIQLTGRSNYRRYGKLIEADLENHPLAAEDPDIAVEVAIAYWLDKKCNEPAFLGKFEEVTRRINGGLNGLSDRLVWYERVNKLPYLLKDL